MFCKHKFKIDTIKRTFDFPEGYDISWTFDDVKPVYKHTYLCSKCDKIKTEYNQSISDYIDTGKP